MLESKLLKNVTGYQWKNSQQQQSMGNAMNRYTRKSYQGGVHFINKEESSYVSYIQNLG